MVKVARLFTKRKRVDFCIRFTNGSIGSNDCGAVVSLGVGGPFSVANLKMDTELFRGPHGPIEGVLINNSIKLK